MKKTRIDEAKPTPGGATMTNSVNTANENVATIEQVNVRKTETSMAEVCFGALMAIAAIAGIWGAVSLLISYFIG